MSGKQIKVVIIDNCGDDAEFNVGGTILKFVRSGYEVLISRNRKINEKHIEAAEILGVKQEWIKMVEGDYLDENWGIRQKILKY